MLNSKETTKKKSNKSKFVLLFIIFEFIFTAVTAPFVLYHGPFKNIKTIVVGSAMTTLTLQGLVTSFISDEKIKQIMSEQNIESITQDNVDGVNGIKVEHKNDNTIERYDLTCEKFRGYMLVIKDPTRIKVGFASMPYKSGEPTSEIAKNNRAIAAINGGAFLNEHSELPSIENGTSPTGIIMSDGKIIFNNIENYDETNEVIALTKSGKLLVGRHSISEMKIASVEEAVSFGPALIVNGVKAITTGDGGWGIAPRTAIAQKKDGTIIFIVIDGRRISSFGATLRELQDELYKFGAYNAANLDGGSSSTLFYNDEVINNPCGKLGERKVPSIIYVEKERKQ
ncbi:phosphodiester glycosidase family protein [Clostridium sp.]|uniref:phosphodiester glycosidase family protein n=1 Tax=Clostridium sp. TaxID=1506 RepID=UPI003F4B1F3C